MKSLIKTLLRESLLRDESDMNNKALMDKFILFVNDYLSLDEAM